jgi:hypothetical protein
MELVAPYLRIQHFQVYFREFSTSEVLRTFAIKFRFLISLYQLMFPVRREITCVNKSFYVMQFPQNSEV